MKRFSLPSVSLAFFLVLFSSERAPAQAAPPPATERAPIAGRILTLDECIAIALEAQPRIQATLSDYAAARYRVNQALSPLLPQLSGLVSATRSHSILTATKPESWGRRDRKSTRLNSSHLVISYAVF